jgi:hypothetical protein
MVYSLLVPLDGSEVSECVLPHVEALAAVNRAIDITFLHVDVPP